MRDDGSGNHGREDAMLTGTHVILYSTDAVADRAFLHDVLGWSGVDAGDGWMIFALPPAEVAVHPTDGDAKHELYLMCDDIGRTLSELSARGVEATRPATDRGWGVVATLRMPSGAELSLYEPRHPVAYDRS
jgi:predicted enzyme related to lactoylglutathione lyase